MAGLRIMAERLAGAVRIFGTTSILVRLRDARPNGFRSSFSYALLAVGLAAGLGVTLLNPYWRLFPEVSYWLDPIFPISTPVDGRFYLLNAECGFRWNPPDPLSLAFHPLLSWLLAILPNWISLAKWFWLISLVFSVGALLLCHRITEVVTEDQVASGWLLTCLVAPGGLAIATGNAEMPTLFFSALLWLSVLHARRLWVTVAAGSLAILVKPNALYMVPVLAVYASSHSWEHRNIRRNALMGIATIVIIWFGWIAFVDWNAGQVGTYWMMRKAFNPEASVGSGIFFEHFSSVLLHRPVLHDQVRYATALIIPLISFVILGLIPLRDMPHRYAMAAGITAMLAIVLGLGNPNKIIVYSTTLPGHFLTHMLFLRHLVQAVDITPTRRIFMGCLYGLYCFMMLGVYVLGTPRRWYY